VKLRLLLLGRFDVERQGSPIPSATWRRRRAVDLLKRVALAPGRLVHREQLVEQLWPDKDLESGANNLYQALHYLRRVLGGGFVSAERGVVRLSAEVWVDVEEFERRVAAGDPESLADAVALYRGDLCPDDPYSDSLETRRESLRHQFVDAALKLARHHVGSGLEARAANVLRRLLAVDRAHEEAHCALMEALARAGRRQEALRQFQACVEALQELDAEASAFTRSLHQSIVSGEVGPARLRTEKGWIRASRRLLGTAAPPPLRGRSTAVASMEELARSRGGVLLLTGEAGVGKTRLAVEGARFADTDGALVLAAASLESERSAPYAPFIEVWADHLRGAGRSPADSPFAASISTPGGDPQVEKLRLFQSVERSLESFAGGRPVYIVIDDLHLLDESSLHLFHYLARAARTQPLMLVATCREEEMGIGTPGQTLLCQLRRTGQRLAVERLDLRATRQHVADLLGREPDDAVARSIYELTGGIPFYTEEVVHAWKESGQMSEVAVPEDLSEMTRERVARLGPEAELFLVTASVAGMHFTFEAAARASGQATATALAALDKCLGARLVEEGDRGYRFRHALVRQALYGALTRARRVRMHAAVAEALEAEGADAAESQDEALATHFRAGEQRERALPYFIRAGQRAATRLGFREAVRFFEQAVELMEALGREPGPDLFALLLGMGQMRVALAELDAAVGNLDAAASLARGANGWRPSSTERAQARRWAILALITAGRLDEARARMDAALQEVEGRAADPELPYLLYHEAQLQWHEGHYEDAYRSAQRCLSAAERLGEPRVSALGYEMLALACHATGDWRDGLGFEEKRQAMVGASNDVAQVFDAHLCLWEYHLYGDRGAPRLEEMVARTHEQATRMGAPRAIALCRCFSGALDFHTGRWDAAEQALREALGLYREIGAAGGESLSLQRLGILLTARGRLDDARSTLAEGILVAERAILRSHCLTRLYAAMARSRLGAGEVTEAETFIGEGEGVARRQGFCHTCNTFLWPEAVRVMLAANRIEEAERYARQLEAGAERYPSVPWRAVARQARGRVLAARGLAGEARTAFREARDAFLSVGWKYEAARALLGEARALRDLGGAADALEADAEAAFRALGAAGIEA